MACVLTMLSSHMIPRMTPILNLRPPTTCLFNRAADFIIPSPMPSATRLTLKTPLTSFSFVILGNPPSTPVTTSFSPTSSTPSVGSMIQVVRVWVAAATCQDTQRKMIVRRTRSTLLPHLSPPLIPSKTPRAKSPLVSAASQMWNCSVKVSRECRPIHENIEE